MAIFYINTASTGGNGTTNATSGATAAYSSWDAFASAEAGTLTESLIVNCDGAGGADSSSFTLTGWGSTSSNTITIQQNSNGSPYTIQVTGTVTAFNEYYYEIDGITIESTVTGRELARSSNPSTTLNQSTFNNVLFKTTSATSSSEFLNFPKANLNIDFINCRYEGGARIADLRNVNACNINYCSFVMHQDNIGILSDSATDIQNTYVGAVGGNSAGDFWTGGSPTGNNNASSDTTATTQFTSSVASQNPEAIFTSTTAGSVDFGLVASTSLEGAGTPIAGITEDFEGDTRDATSPDIGADELASGDSVSPNLSLPSASITNIAATLGATTDEANGTAHAVITLSGNQTALTNAEVIAGTIAGNILFAASDKTISSTGAFTFDALSGLTGNTAYGYAIVHVDSSGNEDAGSRVNGTFTTQSAEVSFTLTNVPSNQTGIEYYLTKGLTPDVAVYLDKGTGETIDSNVMVIDLNGVSVTAGDTIIGIAESTTGEGFAIKSTVTVS